MNISWIKKNGISSFLALTFCASSIASPTVWQPAGWGGGGYFWSALIDPRGQGLMYLGGDVDGAYKSTDRGLHWRFINKGLSNYEVYSMALCLGEPRFIYAMTVNGICRSEDEGESWRALPQTQKKALNISAKRGDTVRGLAVHSKDPLRVWAGSQNGRLFATTDGGETWQGVTYGKAPEETGKEATLASVAIADKDPSKILLAHRGQGIFLSHDGGKSWSPTLSEKGAFSAVFAPGDATRAYAGFDRGRVFRSVDGGRNWTAASKGIPEKMAVRELAVDPRDPKKVVGIGSEGWGGHFCSTADGGETWVVSRPKMKVDFSASPTLPADPASGELSSPTNISLNPKNPDEIFISCNWRNAYSLDGGKTWEERSRGADISVIEDIQFAGGKVYATAMDEGLLVSSNEGKEWKQLYPLRWIDETSGHQWRVRVWEVSGQTHVLSTDSPWNGKFPNKILRSENGGLSFDTNAVGLPTCVPTRNTMWGRSYPKALAQDPGNPSLLYLGMDGDPDPASPACVGGFFRSEDGGKTWRQPSQQPGSRRIFFGLALDPSEPKRLYWGACGEGGGLYRSENRGDSWIKIFDKDEWIFNVVVTGSGRVLAGGKHLWASDNQGGAWKALTNLEDGCTTVAIEFDPTDEKRIWMARTTWDSDARGGIYQTLDGGATWVEITGDIPYVKPLILRYDLGKRTLWAGGVGLFKTQP